MKILTLSFSLVAFYASSQTAPVTSLGIVTDASPGTVTIPVTVAGFMNVGQFTLTFTYETTCVTYNNYTAHPAFTGLNITPYVTGTTGTLVITWPGTAANYTLPDSTHLLDINFSYLTGTTYLSWNTSGTNCQYKTYSGGTYVALSDTPKSKYYKRGGIGDRGAPVVTAPAIGNAVTGNIAVPITVTEFNAIQGFTLELVYDQNVLTYQNCTPNPSLSGSFTAGSIPSGDKKKVSVIWTGLCTLTNGSTLFTINFAYSGTNASYSTLNWYDNGPSCVFSSAGEELIDFPTASYFNSGVVYTQHSAKAFLPVITDAVPFSTLPIPVQTEDFTDIYSFSLSFEFDTAALVYNSFTPNAELSTMTVVNNGPVGSKRKLVISWTGAVSKTLSDGSTIANLAFTYKTNSTGLAWVVTDATSCIFNDALGHAYYDLPKNSYYTNGMVSSHPAPKTIAWHASPANGQQVTIPVYVYDFTNIGLFSLTLDYDPAVLTYQGASLVPAIGGSFMASSPGPGRITMGWSGTVNTLPDNTGLIDLTFNYNGGGSPLAWYDNGTSCRYAAGSTDSAYYDQPGAHYYINGYVGPDPLIADFTASTFTPEINSTVTLTDITTGSPTAWNWSISPETYVFVNGTSAFSQNPQVQFTVTGPYTITLIAYRGITAGMNVKDNYIHAGIAGLWTGISSADWNNPLNWHNIQVPVESTDVAIPASAPTWPQVTGDLALGTSCNTITLEGTAHLQVEGDLSISAGSAMTFTGNGVLLLGGDWSNLGEFNPGTGTVEFTGLNDAAVLAGPSTETFYKIILSKINANLSIQGNVNVIGTE